MPSSILTHIGARAFRNYPVLDVEVPPGWVTIYGPNGAGKTNILELLLLTSAHLLFHGTLADTVQWGQERAETQVSLASGDDLRATIQRSGSRAQRSYLLNGRPAPDAYDRLYPVLFLPQEDALLHTASGRRRLVSRGMLFASSRYAALLYEYHRTLQQRNMLFKRGGYTQSEMDAWTETLLPLLREIWELRHAWVMQVNALLPAMLPRAGGADDGITLAFSFGGKGKDIPDGGAITPAAVPEVSELQQWFTEVRSRETLLRTTLIGPHRDLCTFVRGGKDYLQTSSRGQARTLLLALHMIEGDIAKAQGRDTLYLLDDVFSELDRAHREAIIAHAGETQVVLTTADDHLLPELRRMGSVFRASDGTLTIDS